MASKRIELWLKQDGKIEQITDHEAFSEKIKHVKGNAFNVIILTPTSIYAYKTYYNPETLVFEYAPLTVSVAQLEKAIGVAKLLSNIS